MNKKHIAGYAVTALVFLGLGAASNGGGTPESATPPSTATVTVTAPGPTTTAVGPTVTAAGPTVTVTPPAVTETVEAPTVTETVNAGPPEPSRDIPGDGTFEVGVDVEPGTYVSEASDGCYWARLSGSDGFDSIIDNHFGNGQMIVTIKASDRFFETAGCNPWSRR